MILEQLAKRYPQLYLIPGEGMESAFWPDPDSYDFLIYLQGKKKTLYRQILYKNYPYG